MGIRIQALAFSAVVLLGASGLTACGSEDGGDAEHRKHHLTKEEVRFEGGDFSSPTAIHGDDMPGLQELSEGASEIDVEYTEIPTGAELTFTTTGPALVQALHAWADTQVYDHGDHASQD